MQLVRALLIAAGLYAIIIGAILLSLSVQSTNAVNSVTMSMAGGLVTIVGMYGIAESNRLKPDQ